MATAVLESLIEVDHYAHLMARAQDTDAVTSVLNTYLSSWSEERIERLQAIDGGWAPFDEWLRPMPILGVRDILFLPRAIRDHCRAVRAAGVEIATELLELDLVLFFAAERAAGDDSGRALAMEYA